MPNVATQHNAHSNTAQKMPNTANLTRLPASLDSSVEGLRFFFPVLLYMLTNSASFVAVLLKKSNPFSDVAGS